jgi:biotin carboxyl carrier protein
MAKYKVSSDGKEFDVTVSGDSMGGAKVEVAGHTFDVSIVGGAPVAVVPAASAAPATARPAPAAAPRPASAAPAGAGAVTAPIPGVILKVLVKVGDAITVGQSLLILEAMKMENDITAQVAGTVTEISVSEGDQVGDGQALVVIG